MIISPAVKKNLLSVLWVILAVLSVIIDYYTGKIYNFPILIAIPIVSATWFNGRSFGILIGMLIMTGEFFLISIWLSSISYIIITVYISVRLILTLSFIILVDIIRRQTKEIKVLRGFLPICSFCKKIRDDKEDWIEMERFIDDHSEAKFSHSLCPECARLHYGEFIKS